MPSLVTIKHCVKGYWVKNCKMCPILLKKRTWILPLVYVKVLVSAYAALKPFRVKDMSMISDISSDMIIGTPSSLCM